MLLAVDCGNTNTVFSIWDGEKFVGTWRTATDWRRTADQYFVWLNTLIQAQGIKADITDVIISSTVPRVVFNLRVLADRYYNTRPLRTVCCQLRSGSMRARQWDRTGW